MDKYIGTEIKILVRVTDIDGGYTLRDVSFNCMFYTTAINSDPTKKVVLQKSQLYPVDNDSYIAVVDSALTGPGNLMCRMTLWVPDTETTDGKRTEVLRGKTNVNIIE